MGMNVIMGGSLKSNYTLFDSIQATCLLTDTHSKILYTNRQAESFFGYQPEELEGQRIRILFLEEDLIYFLPNILFLTLYKKGFEGEALLRQKDGKKIFAHLFTGSFREEEEVFLIFTFQEIQRLKILEREKVEVDRWASLGRMAEGIAHQFRNPVASIGGYANRLLKGQSSRKSRSYVSQILQETGRLEAILQRVEEYVRIPRAVLRKEKIQEVVEVALSNFSKPGKEKEISFHLQANDLARDGQLFIDRGLMIKAISNILENSLDAVSMAPLRRQKKGIEVSLADDGEVVEVSISDQGQGIATKDLSMIFEPFFSTRADRVGLGLTFARRVMKEHAGKIRVESQAGKGTTVTLYLPKDRRRKVRREWISPESVEREDG
ncbi:MAG: ATP-binding protein [Thermodesulfobacteriota bacterium]|jgi:PAS domain S-box-containing protein